MKVFTIKCIDGEMEGKAVILETIPYFKTLIYSDMRIDDVLNIDAYVKHVEKLYKICSSPKVERIDSLDLDFFNFLVYVQRRDLIDQYECDVKEKNEKIIRLQEKVLKLEMREKNREPSAQNYNGRNHFRQPKLSCESSSDEENDCRYTYDSDCQKPRRSSNCIETGYRKGCRF